MNNVTVGLLAHVDAGKTTFAEQLLYHTAAIRRRGRVDHQDSFMDTHEIEKSRGITVFADQAEFTYRDSRYFLLDTPGHVDFSPEMERCLQVLDYAVVILSAVEGVQSHTETLWQLLRQHRIPVLFFINKTDRAGSDPVRVLEEIRQLLSPHALLLPQQPEAAWTDEAKAFLAERNESLLERYLEGTLPDSDCRSALRTMVKRGEIFRVCKVLHCLTRAWRSSCNTWMRLRSRSMITGSLLEEGSTRSAMMPEVRELLTSKRFKGC